MYYDWLNQVWNFRITMQHISGHFCLFAFHAVFVLRCLIHSLIQPLSLVLTPYLRLIAQSGRGYKTTPKWGIKPPPTPFLAIFDPWGGFMPPWGGFIPPFAGVGLSPQRGGFIPPFGHWGGFITPLGWFYPPFWVILSPYWRGGGVGQSQCEPRKLSPGRQTDAQCTLQPALV